jgi:microcystin-dependent protein
MSSPFIGEIRMFGGNFAPQGWMFCDGSILPIDQFDVLFSLIGTTYGGDGQQTFALPDLRGRVPIHQGTFLSSFVLGEVGGSESVTLTQSQIPGHTHPLLGSSAGAASTSPAGNVPATMAGVTTFAYGTDLPPTTFAPQSVTAAGGNQPHDNLQPYLCISFIISLFGIYPSQN